MIPTNYLSENKIDDMTSKNIYIHTLKFLIKND